MKQGQSLQLLFNGSTTYDQKDIYCQRPIHSLSISQLQTRKSSDCTMGTKELLLSQMHGSLAAMKQYDLESVSMDCQWPETWSPACRKCLPVLIAPVVEEIALFVLASCQYQNLMPVHRARQHPPPQSTAHPLSLVALQHAGQCAA